MSGKMVTAVLILAGIAAGFVLGQKLNPESTGSPENMTGGTPEKKVLYWVAPMDPNFKQEKPGKSPMGMDLVPVYEETAGDDGSIRISPAVENNLGVRSEQARLRPLWRRIEATGYVGFDETRISHINTRVQGWIVKLQADSEGERISKGDLLFELYSPELVNAQKEYLQAVKRGGARLVSGADEKLRALGMIPSQIKALASRGTASENIKIIAPQDGIITALNVREGMYIQPNTTIMSLADLSSVWLQAEVFESQADWVAEGQAAEARLDYMPGTEFSGRVNYIYPVLDPKTRTLRVRLKFDNPNERLKPNMYARVSIYGRLKPNALSIPREALIRAPGNDRVVVSLGEGKFHVHEVMTGMESGEYVEILSGISEGDSIVTSAQFLIDSEASIAGSVRRLESQTHSPAEQGFEAVFGSGKVEELDLNRRQIRVSHGPIDALGWPGMTMVFDVEQGVNLGAVGVGQDIRFALVQKHAGDYVIEQINSSESGSGAMAEVSPDSVAVSKGAEDTGKTSEPRTISARAIVRSIDAANQQVKLAHQPITELKWPAMTMNFNVRSDLDLGAVHEGQNIHFSMVELPDGKWLIDQIHVMSEEAVEGEDEND